MMDGELVQQTAEPDVHTAHQAIAFATEAAEQTREIALEGCGWTWLFWGEIGRMMRSEAEAVASASLTEERVRIANPVATLEVVRATSQETAQPEQTCHPPQFPELVAGTTLFEV